MNFVSVDNLHYAILTKDDATGVLYGTPKPFGPAVKISVDPDTPNANFYADGILQETATFVPGGKISIEASTLPFAIKADLFGHMLDNKGGIVDNSNDVAPYVAILYKRTKSNGKSRWIRLLKCQFQEPKSDAETKDASIKFQDDVVEGVFLPRRYDNQWRYSVDEEEAGYVDISGTFFTAVDSTADTTRPEIASTVPAADATGVALNSTYAITFTKAMNPSTITADNIYLIDDTSGNAIAGTVSYDAATKTATLDPVGSLLANHKYTAIVDTDVADTLGNHIYTVVSRSFTTVAA